MIRKTSINSANKYTYRISNEFCCKYSQVNWWFLLHTESSADFVTNTHTESLVDSIMYSARMLSGNFYQKYYQVESLMLHTESSMNSTILLQKGSLRSVEILLPYITDSQTFSTFFSLHLLSCFVAKKTKKKQLRNILLNTAEYLAN